VPSGRGDRGRARKTADGTLICLECDSPTDSHRSPYCAEHRDSTGRRSSKRYREALKARTHRPSDTVLLSVYDAQIAIATLNEANDIVTDARQWLTEPVSARRVQTYYDLLTQLSETVEQLVNDLRPLRREITAVTRQRSAASRRVDDAGAVGGR
jgi:hypothetical protein